MNDHLETNASWRRLLTALAVVMPLWAVALTIVAGEIIPPVLIFAVLFVGAAVLLRRLPNRAGPITFLVVSVLLIALNAPFILGDLSHPESALGFILTVIPTITGLLGIVASIGALRAWPSPKATLAWRVAAGLFAVLVVVGVVAALGLEDDTAVAGDLHIAAEEIEFAPNDLTAPVGTVGFFIDNDDPIRHTFSIEDEGIEIELPAGTARRVEVDLAAGTYTFVCTVPGHEDMEGTLTVSG